MKKMKNGESVLIRLSSEDDDVWHSGTVIKARKEWVELDKTDRLAPFIADES